MAKPDPGLSSWPLPSPQCTNICTMTCFIFMILKTLHPPSVSLGDDCPALRPPDSVVSRWADSLPVSKPTPLDSSPFFCSCLYSLSVHRGSTWAQSPHHSSPAPPLLFLWPPPPTTFPLLTRVQPTGSPTGFLRCARHTPTPVPLPSLFDDTWLVPSLPSSCCLNSTLLVRTSLTHQKKY